MTQLMTGATRFWLLKSEPDAFSWAQQCARGVEPWTGVRNHAARNNLRAMQVQDRGFFYHSNVGRQIMGVVAVVRTAYPDPTAAADAQARWCCVDVQALYSLPQPVSLAMMKNDPVLQDLPLIRQPRLSVMPVSSLHWARICQLGECDAACAYTPA